MFGQCSELPLTGVEPGSPTGVEPLVSVLDDWSVCAARAWARCRLACLVAGLAEAPATGPPPIASTAAIRATPRLRLEIICSPFVGGRSTTPRAPGDVC